MNVHSIFGAILLAVLCFGLQGRSIAQCTNSTQPLSSVRLATGPININADGFKNIPTIEGIPSALTQVTQAASDLNNALGGLYTFAINAGTTTGNQVWYTVNTDPGIGAPEILKFRVVG